MECKICRNFVVFVFIFWLICGVVGRLRLIGIQKSWPKTKPFPCENNVPWRSDMPPTNVNNLRPGDIDVIAALGDSLTAAHGALDDNLYQIILNENRGVSWSMGGQGTWREYLTVPNLLKVMNPNLIGYSLGNGSPFSKNAQFNMAFAGACDQDLMLQAENLVTRLKSDPRVDFKNHWKLITLMIGTNDICTDVCYDYANQSAENHKNYLNDIFLFIKNNIPRALVNFVIMPWIPDYATLTDPPYPTCIMQLIDCPCLFGGSMSAEKLANSTEMTKKFREAQQELGKIWANRSTETFAVVFQPTLLNSRFPKRKRKNSRDAHDYSFISADCIHYSQKLQASIANAYWNNLFESADEKTKEWMIPAYKEFKCPSKKRPFIVTNDNDFDVNSNEGNVIANSASFENI